MPLEKSPTNAARQRNIEREIDAGKPPRQAVAIGYSEQRRAGGAPPRRRVSDIGRSGGSTSPGETENVPPGASRRALRRGARKTEARRRGIERDDHQPRMGETNLTTIFDERDRD